MKRYHVIVTAIVPRPSRVCCDGETLMCELMRAIGPLRHATPRQDVRIYLPVHLEVYAEDRANAMAQAKRAVEDRLTDFVDVAYLVEVA